MQNWEVWSFIFLHQLGIQSYIAAFLGSRITQITTWLKQGFINKFMGIFCEEGRQRWLLKRCMYRLLFRKHRKGNFRILFNRYIWGLKDSWKTPSRNKRRCIKAVEIPVLSDVESISVISNKLQYPTNNLYLRKAYEVQIANRRIIKEYR